MNRNFHAAALIAAMSAFTILLRFLPFAVFRKKVPDSDLDEALLNDKMWKELIE